MQETERENIQGECLDRFYMEHGPCCAGCDHWAYFSSTLGECTRSAPVSGHERMLAMGFSYMSCPVAAGHVITDRAHVCGEFSDSFDWSTLPLRYLKRIGYTSRKEASKPERKEAITFNEWIAMAHKQPKDTYTLEDMRAAFHVGQKLPAPPAP